MEPGSTASVVHSHRHSQPLANLMGTLIALLTLTAPMMSIAYFSSNHFFSSSFSTEDLSSSQGLQVSPQLLKSRE
jgi:hypothetical protein